jgi:hypothetical protein
MEETFSGCFKIKNFAWKKIYEKSGSEKSFIPKLERHRSIYKQSNTNFNDMTIFSFSGTILLMSMRARDMMSDTNFLEEPI